VAYRKPGHTSPKEGDTTARSTTEQAEYAVRHYLEQPPTAADPVAVRAVLDNVD
jgi:hypothetical protein